MKKATGKFGLELRNERTEHLGKVGNFKKIQNHEYRVPEESWEYVDVEKPKRCNEDRNLLHPDKQARHRHKSNSHQPRQHWK